MGYHRKILIDKSARSYFKNLSWGINQKGGPKWQQWRILNSPTPKNIRLQIEQFLLREN